MNAHFMDTVITLLYVLSSDEFWLLIYPVDVLILNFILILGQFYWL